MVRVRPISFCMLAGILAVSARAFAQTGQPPTGLSLQAAVDALVDKNLPVMAARYNVDLFRAQRVAAALKPDPTLVISGTQFTLPRVLSHPSYAGVATADNAILNTQYMVDVEKLIERGDKRQLRIAQADKQTAMAEAQLANELRQQTFELKQAFLAALLARENLRVFRNNLGDFGRMQQVFAAQVKEGYAAGVDVRRIGLELVEVQRSVSTAQTEYVQGVRDVLNLIGEGDSGSLDGASPIVQTTAVTARASQVPSTTVRDTPDVIDGDLNASPIGLDIEALRTLALANRPDLQAAQLELDAANEGLKLAEATRVRDVTVGAQYLRSGPDNAVGVAVGVPLTTGRRAETAVAQATAVKRQADAHVRQARAQVLTDVEKAFIAYRISRDRLRLFDSQILRQASEVRNIEQVAYREGERGLLSFLDAQRTYNQTLVNYNEARHAFALSVYQLEAATGTSATLLKGQSSPVPGVSP